MEMPKSPRAPTASPEAPSRRSKMFSGFRSRCRMTPSNTPRQPSWQKRRPSHASTSTFTRSHSCNPGLPGREGAGSARCLLRSPCSIKSVGGGGAPDRGSSPGEGSQRPDRGSWRRSSATARPPWTQLGADRGRRVGGGGSGDVTRSASGGVAGWCEKNGATGDERGGARGGVTGESGAALARTIHQVQGPASDATGAFNITEPTTNTPGYRDARMHVGT